MCWKLIYFSQKVQNNIKVVVSIHLLIITFSWKSWTSLVLYASCIYLQPQIVKCRKKLSVTFKLFNFLIKLLRDFGFSAEKVYCEKRLESSWCCEFFLALMLIFILYSDEWINYYLLDVIINCEASFLFSFFLYMYTQLYRQCWILVRFPYHKLYGF